MLYAWLTKDMNLGKFIILPFSSSKSGFSPSHKRTFSEYSSGKKGVIEDNGLAFSAERTGVGWEPVTYRTQFTL